MKNKKIAIIGAGSVGLSFIFSAINMNLASEYILIDLNEGISEGNALDLEDASPLVDRNFTIRNGSYEDIKDADVIAITAGRSQKENETRLDMVSENSKIMKQIALDVKRSGFNGITLIASNPVDIMAHVFMTFSGFDPRKVISTGTTLDTSRLKVGLSKLLLTEIKSIDAYVFGEHGDSSVAALSNATIDGINLMDFAKDRNVSEDQINTVVDKARSKAYEIIDRKGATWYGIGLTLATLADAIINDKQLKMPVSTLLNGEYGIKDIYISVLSIIGKNGVESTIDYPLSGKETELLIESSVIMKNILDSTLESIK